MTAPRKQKTGAGRPLVIWRLIDGKPGHENQSLGLCNALDRLVGVVRHDIPAGGRLPAWLHWLSSRFPAGAGLPSPDLIVGAGHQTHPALLAARRAFGGRAVVIMKPSLPPGLFDLCIIPEHDGVTGTNIFVTRGVMNTVSTGRSGVSPRYRPGDGPPTAVAPARRDCTHWSGAAAKPPAGEAAPAREDSSQSLILLGGTSAHYQWRDTAVLNQVEAIVRNQPGERFILSDSRRTPQGFMQKLAALGLANLSLIPWQETGAGWVARQLGQSHAVWVSEDSVSMVYEALTSGAAVGLIRLEQDKPGRITRGVERLVGEGWVTPFELWVETGGFVGSPGAFDEAARCAEWMVGQWL